MGLYEVLREENIILIDQAVVVISKLNKDIYGNSNERGLLVSQSCGKHFRHIANFYQNFIENTTGRYNYDQRLRDNRIEENPEYALQFYLDLKSKLLRRIKEDQAVFTWSGKSAEWIPSSEERELKYILDHTIHHFAIISLLLRAVDVKVPEEFGVAPTSIEYYREG